MPFKYSQIFKDNALHLWEELEEKNEIEIKGIVIKNVRELCSYLGISSYTLYNWRDKKIIRPKLTETPESEQKADLDIPDIAIDIDFALDSSILNSRFYGWLGMTLKMINDN